MALVDKYVTPMDRLMVILQVLSLDKLRLVLRFAESLVEKEGRRAS
ncbi:hypothetical protein ES705_36893 [subsurface metagenome]|jgi:hypothetical protein